MGESTDNARQQVNVEIGKWYAINFGDGHGGRYVTVDMVVGINGIYVVTKDASGEVDMATINQVLCEIPRPRMWRDWFNEHWFHLFISLWVGYLLIQQACK